MQENRELGFLCRNCERVKFGETFSNGHWKETDGCALCARDSFVYLPIWQPVVEELAGGDMLLRNEYEVTSETVTLCDEHYASLDNQSEASKLHDVSTDVETNESHG